MTYYKTEPYLFGVWKVSKQGDPIFMGRDTGRRWWNTEKEAWEYLLLRVDQERIQAAKDLNKINRDRAKALKALHKLKMGSIAADVQ